MLGKFTTAFVDVLDANLGSGHNSLSFLSMQSDGDRIKGIKYDPKTGQLEYLHGNNQLHRVGTVLYPEILVASNFKDHINLYATTAGENDIDFTVFKFKGSGVYEINISTFADVQETKNFKIIDSTTNGQDENQCTGHHYPRIEVINLGSNAIANDIIYEINKILKGSFPLLVVHRPKRPIAFCSLSS